MMAIPNFRASERQAPNLNIRQGAIAITVVASLTASLCAGLILWQALAISWRYVMKKILMLLAMLTSLPASAETLLRCEGIDGNAFYVGEKSWVKDGGGISSDEEV